MNDETQFAHDVFLSHSVKDKDLVGDIANRLKSDGVRVWFDELEIRPGDSIPAKIEESLERSRVLVLCMSAAALAADWPQLESHTVRFKDSVNNTDDSFHSGSTTHPSKDQWPNSCASTGDQANASKKIRSIFIKTL